MGKALPDRKKVANLVVDACALGGGRSGEKPCASGCVGGKGGGGG
jgi:hypothetical protein